MGKESDIYSWNLQRSYPVMLILSSFHPHPHKPQDACAEVVWLTHVWHEGHETSNVYHMSWHFLDCNHFWTGDLCPLGIHCCYGVVLYIEYFFLQSLRDKVAAHCLFFFIYWTHISIAIICFPVGFTGKTMAYVTCCNLAANIPLLRYRVFCSQDTFAVVLTGPDILSRLDRNDSFLVLLLGMFCIVNTHNFSKLSSFF